MNRNDGETSKNGTPFFFSTVAHEVRTVAVRRGSSRAWIKSSQTASQGVKRGVLQRRRNASEA